MRKKCESLHLYTLLHKLVYYFLLHSTMDITFALRSSIPFKNRRQHATQSKAELKARLHEPNDDAECPILQESIKHSQGLEWFPRPFDASSPHLSAITLPCSHTFHGMALVYNWARNRNVLCPVCRAGPQQRQLVMSKLPRDWKYSMAARIRKGWKDDKQKAEEDNRQAAVSIATMSLQPHVLRFSIMLHIESLPGIFIWVGHAIAIPGAGGLIFHVRASDLATMPFAYGDIIRIMPFLHVHPVNFVSNLIPSHWVRFGIDDAGSSYSFRFEDAVPTDPGARRKVTQILYALNEDLFAQALATSLIIINEA